MKVEMNLQKHEIPKFYFLEKGTLNYENLLHT